MKIYISLSQKVLWIQKLACHDAIPPGEKKIVIINNYVFIYLEEQYRRKHSKHVTCPASQGKTSTVSLEFTKKTCSFSCISYLNYTFSYWMIDTIPDIATSQTGDILEIRFYQVERNGLILLSLCCVLRTLEVKFSKTWSLLVVGLK